MKIEWATDEVKVEVERQLAIWYGTDETNPGEEDPEKFMKELGWEYMPFDMNAKPYDAIVCASDLIALGARLQEEGVKELTILTDLGITFDFEEKINEPRSSDDKERLDRPD